MNLRPLVTWLETHLAWLASLLVLTALAGCGDGGGQASALGEGDDPTATTRSGEPHQGLRLVSELRGGGYVIYLRHTATDWSEDDEQPVDLADCDTQRNLSELGRAQAREIGEAFEALEIPVGSVLSSPYCRALDTAELAFGRAASEPALDNLENVESDAESDERTEGLRQLLSAPPQPGTNTVLSGHGYNVQAIAEEAGAEEGDAEIFRPERGGGFALEATLTPSDWTEFARRVATAGRTS